MIKYCFLVGLALFLSFGSVQSDHIAEGDFDRDGDVDFTDYLIFANNFGKSYTTQTKVPHLDVVQIVVRDTLYRTITHTIRDTITEIRLVNRELPRPEIRIEGGGWRLPRFELQAVLEDVRDVFSERLMYPYVSNIAVRHHLDGPFLRAHRTSDGSYIVGLDVHSAAQTIYQFSHEYTHIISGKRPTIGDSKQLWVEETICMIGTYFALKRLSEKWKNSSDYNDRNRGRYLESYYQQAIQDVQAPQNLQLWYQIHKTQLEQNPRWWPKIKEAALALFDIFEQHPDEAWNAIRYKDKGVEQYEEFFDLYEGCA